MKHIKLFEDFNEDIYIEDAKYIIILHLGEVKEIKIDPKRNANDILRFDIEETPTEEQIKRCEEHLKEEGFFLNIDIKECIVGIGNSNSIDEYCLNWLNANFGDLKPVIKDEKIYYVDKDNNPFFFYKHDIDGYCWIGYDNIWSFFKDDLGLYHEEIQDITRKWLELTYNLMGLKPNPLPNNLLTL